MGSVTLALHHPPDRVPLSPFCKPVPLWLSGPTRPHKLSTLTNRPHVSEGWSPKSASTGLTSLENYKSTCPTHFLSFSMSRSHLAVLRPLPLNTAIIPPPPPSEFHLENQHSRTLICLSTLPVPPPHVPCQPGPGLPTRALQSDFSSTSSLQIPQSHLLMDPSASALSCCRPSADCCQTRLHIISDSTSNFSDLSAAPHHPQRIH